MVRKHASLEKDQEINEAGWVATQGAAVGAAKVRSTPILTRSQFLGEEIVVICKRKSADE